MDTLLELEEYGWQAMSSTGDADFLEQWLADDALMVVPGMIIDRITFLTALASEPPWQSHQIENPQIRKFAEDCAAVLYQVTAQRESQAPYIALMTSVYALRGGDWKLIYHQQTPAPAE
jgi:hypothetical protein